MHEKGHQDSQWLGSTCAVRKGWNMAAFSACRTDFFGETQQQPSSTYREVKEKMEPSSSQWWRTRNNGHKLKQEVKDIGKKFSL